MSVRYLRINVYNLFSLGMNHPQSSDIHPDFTDDESSHPIFRKLANI